MTVLVGKGRRITLDELRLVSCGEARLEARGDDVPAAAGDDAAPSAAMGKLSLSDSGGDDGAAALAPDAAVASLALLSLTLAQGRVVRGDCGPRLAAALADVANRAAEEGGGTDLPEDAGGFAEVVNSLVGGDLGILEDRPYLGRLISLARASLALARGT